ncbi:MAG: hypothetical protein P8X68_17135 [Desulfobacterales bacterium]
MAKSLVSFFGPLAPSGLPQAQAGCRVQRPLTLLRNHYRLFLEFTGKTGDRLLSRHVPVDKDKERDRRRPMIKIKIEGLAMRFGENVVLEGLNREIFAWP